MKWKVSLSEIDFDQKEKRRVDKVIKSRWLSMGGLVESFQKRFKTYFQVKHAFAASSGTAALHLALKALEIKEGDEVLVPSLTFVACVNAILYTGATPVFLEITDYSDLNLSPDDLERKISPRTKGIIVVHYAGYLTDMERIKNLLKLIENGYIEKILISCDVCFKFRLHKYGGWGYDHILNNIIPFLRHEGINDEQINMLLIENPKRYLNIKG